MTLEWMRFLMVLFGRSYLLKFANFCTFLTLPREPLKPPVLVTDIFLLFGLLVCSLFSLVLETDDDSMLLFGD